jgi:hypothetical protein
MNTPTTHDLAPLDRGDLGSYAQGQSTRIPSATLAAVRAVERHHSERLARRRRAEKKNAEATPAG